MSCSRTQHNVPSQGYNLGQVVQKVDNALKRMNHFPADSTVCFVKTCALDSDVLEKDESFIAGLTPSIKFARTNLYTMFPWVERGTVRVKCLAQEHNTMSPARAQTRTARSGDERTNHEATASPTLY